MYGDPSITPQTVRSSLVPFMSSVLKFAVVSVFSLEPIRIQTRSTQQQCSWVMSFKSLRVCRLSFCLSSLSCDSLKRPAPTAPGVGRVSVCPSALPSFPDTAGRAQSCVGWGATFHVLEPQDQRLLCWPGWRREFQMGQYCSRCCLSIMSSVADFSRPLLG